jgi:lysozyme family protein
MRRYTARILLTALLLIMAGCVIWSCSREKGVDVTVATLQLSPTPSATATATATPPVKHVEPKEQPTPTTKETLTAIVNAQPTIEWKRWSTIKIKPSFEVEVNLLVMRYQRNKSRYETVEHMRSNGVPAPIAFCLHYRESDNDFTCHPHEGSSLAHRTRYVPKGRLPAPKEPPYKWEVSAEDAYYVCDHLEGNWSNISFAFDTMERFNGLGYRKRGVLSPYIYSGTQFYTGGKFVSDGRFSSTALDKQLGCLAILKRLQQKGVSISFDKT